MPLQYSLLPNSTATLAPPPFSHTPINANLLAIKTHHFSSPKFQTIPSKSLKNTRNFKTLHVVAPSTPTPVSEPEQSQDLDFKSEEDYEDDSSSVKFSWRDHWYPVSLVEDLDPKLPTPFQLLGRDIVLWFDKSKDQWVAFDDKCPHRLAPLSVIHSISCVLLFPSFFFFFFTLYDLSLWS